MQIHRNTDCLGSLETTNKKSQLANRLVPSSYTPMTGHARNRVPDYGAAYFNSTQLENGSIPLHSATRLLPAFGSCSR